jgi:hypothetical protein
MGALYLRWRLLALSLLVIMVGVAAPVHTVVAHSGAEAADHLHATCGVCFTLAGAEQSHVCVTPPVAADDHPLALPTDEEVIPPGSPSPADPTRAPPSFPV